MASASDATAQTSQSKIVGLTKWAPARYSPVSATDSAANGVTLNASDVVNLSDTDVLTLAGTASDSVNAGTGWTDAGFDVAGNHVFTKLAGATLATLVVNEDVTVNADITA